MPISDPQNEFPGIPWIGLFLGIAIFFNRNLETLNCPEFSGISLERVLGVPKSRFRGKMKLICWAAVINHNSGENKTAQRLTFWVTIIVNPRSGGCAINPKIVQRSRNDILSNIFQEVRAYFRGVSAYFRGVSAYFVWKLVSRGWETSFEKFGASVATGGLQ